MTPEEIIAKWPNLHMECDEAELLADIRQAVLDEREACAKLVEHDNGVQIAHLIRNR